MPSLVSLLLGIAMLLVASFDIIWTTMREGGGPLTRRITGFLWRSIARSKNRQLLSALGVLVILVALGTWILLLWFGWTLIFQSDPMAIHVPDRPEAIDFFDRLYFVGFTVFTLGIGDITPVGPLWRVLTVVASFSGLCVVTFSITYLIPVVQAATAKRALAVLMHSVAETPSQLVRLLLEEPDTSDHLDAVTSELAQLQQRHIAYPVLHFMHETNPASAVVLAVAVLDEALTIVQAAGLEERVKPSRMRMLATRRVIGALLQTMRGAYVEPSAEPPPAPDLSRLRGRGYALAAEEAYQRGIDGLRDRRCMLRGLVEGDGWSWDQLEKPIERGAWSDEAPLEIVDDPPEAEGP